MLKNCWQHDTISSFMKIGHVRLEQRLDTQAPICLAWFALLVAAQVRSGA